MIRIHTMTSSDLPLVRQLKQQAGWNQLDADLNRFLSLSPDGGIVAQRNDRPAGVTMTFVFGETAWVAMVLVDAALRGQGIGTAMMEHALASLDRQGVKSVRLDATPLGRPMYEKLGFLPEYMLARYHGILPDAKQVGGVEPTPPEALEEVIRLDREITDAARDGLLRLLYDERPDAMRIVRRDGRVDGFLTARPGAHAMQIGPCLASAVAGPLLLADACRRYAGRTVFVDIPTSHTAATRWAREAGLEVQRPLLRMTRGKPVHEQVDRLWASSGPEKG